MDVERISREASLGGALYFEEIGSTNDWGKAWLRGETTEVETPRALFFATKNKTDSQALATSERARVLELTPPFFVGAERQTSGRGQGSRVWSSWRGALLFSLVARWIDFGATRRESAAISLRIAAAVAETARELAPNRQIEVKVPNDVYCEGRKLAGILIESPNASSLVVGVGVNVGNRSEDAPEELRTRVVSLVELIGDEAANVDALREEFAVACVRRMLRSDSKR